MAIKYDLPFESNNGNDPLLLDASASFSILTEQGEGYVWTERMAQNKNSYTPLTKNTESTIHKGYYLVKEQNFQDQGNGMFVWDRLYANIPSTWSAYEVINIPVIRAFSTQLVGEETESRLRFIGLNPQAISPNGSIQIGVRVERSYALEPTLASLSIEGEVEEIYSPLLSENDTFAVSNYEARPAVAEPYVGDIYEIRKYLLTYTWTSTFE